MSKKTKEQISYNMKMIKDKDSGIENALRKELWSRGLRYSKNVTAIFGKPDIAFIRKKVAVFCDGEFWHGYNWNVRKNDFKSNRDFWIPKIERNIERDIEVTNELEKLGYKVLRFWGNEIKKNVSKCADIIEREIRGAKMQYKMIDLCAGIGGIRRGYELAGGFKNVLSAEIDKFACMTYKHVFGDDPTNDITTEEFKQKVIDTKYDILLAGFPCQAFSRAGKKLGFMDDTRGTLFFDIADIIKRTRPKAFMLENVDNLITHDKGSTFSVIINILVNELNYKVIGVSKDLDGKLIYDPKTFVRNSKHFGVPQNRPRVYIMGFDREYFGANVDMLANTLPEKRENALYTDLTDLLEPEAELKYFLSQGYVETLKQHKERHEGKGNGFGYRIVNLPEIKNPIANAILATGGSGKERNLVLDMRSDIEGIQLKNRKTPLNGEGIRVMTPREWGKLQGFINYAFVDEEGKDNFSFPAEIANGQQYKQFGNAVTIPAIEQMALFMKKCLAELAEAEIKSRLSERMTVSMKGNRGEWSEIYTLLKLLSVGKLHEAHYDLRKKKNAFFDIVKIIKTEKNRRIEFTIKPDKTIIIKNSGNPNQKAELPMSVFKDEAGKLLLSIKNSDKTVFEVPETQAFLESIFCSQIKAPPSDKSDISIEYLDGRNKIRHTVGYSIKSTLGRPSTLLNAGKTTNFIYKLPGINDNEMNAFNNFDDGFNKNFSNLKCIPRFVKIDNITFKNNLINIDGNLPEIMAHLLIRHYVYGNSNLIAAINEINKKNPCDYEMDSGISFYENKVKRLLIQSALGMVPSKPWNEKPTANGGYIVVRDDGEVLCLHLFSRSDFEDYLLNNTRFETASRSKNGFGYVYKEGNEFFIKLNLQIRFIK